MEAWIKQLKWHEAMYRMACNWGRDGAVTRMSHSASIRFITKVLKDDYNHIV